MDETNTLKEIDYPQRLIKKVTPFLNDITYIKKNVKNGCKLTLRHRAYAWYYVYNYGNKADAYRRAYYSYYHLGRRKLLPEEGIQQSTLAVGGNKLYRQKHIQQSIVAIRDEIESKIKADVPQTLIEQLMIQATYDPAMFLKVDGTPAFNTWEEIPFKYRCCVISIKKKRYGRNSMYEETEIVLTDRAVARKELQAIAPQLLAPNKVELIHKTVDELGRETGLNMNKLSDKDLLEILNSTKGGK